MSNNHPPMDLPKPAFFLFRPTLLTSLAAILAAAFLWPTGLSAQDCTGKLVLSKVKKGKDTLFYAVNKEPYFPIHVTFNMVMTGHYKFSAPLPVKTVVPGGQKALLGTLTLEPGPGANGVQTEMDFNYGDPAAVPDPGAVYLLPYEHGVKHAVVQGYYGQFTHQSCQCLDFDLAEGSPVCAARDGQVVSLKQDSDIGGMDARDIKLSNYVIVLHSDGTWANYDHLCRNGAAVKLGQRVKAGQLIGYSGHTGMASGPHLHFDVRKGDWYRRESPTVPTVFLQQGGGAVSLQEGKYYYSFHPGGAPFTETKAEMYTEEVLDQYSAPATVKSGAVTLRHFDFDSDVLFYGVNGSSRDKTFTLGFPMLRGYTCSKGLPYTKLVPAGKEVYLLRIHRVDLNKVSGYSIQGSFQ